MNFSRWWHFVKWCVFTVLEKLFHWCIHPKIRSVMLNFAGAHIGKGVRVSEVFFGNAIVGFKNLTLDNDVYIGPNCFVDLTASIYIGTRTAVSPCCSLLTHADPGSIWGNKLTSLFPRRVEGIHIGSDCWIGAGAIILCGVSIGNGSVVGAGAVVMKDVPAHVIVVGNPARILKKIDMN